MKYKHIPSRGQFSPTLMLPSQMLMEGDIPKSINAIHNKDQQFSVLTQAMAINSLIIYDNIFAYQEAIFFIHIMIILHYH